jgi:uncharacterized membrane protein YphA (DoxX/SURF4 family)
VNPTDSGNVLLKEIFIQAPAERVFEALTDARQRVQFLLERSMTSVAVPATASRTRTIAYWVTTVFVCFPLLVGGVGDIMLWPQVVEGMTHLGYPQYFCVILGVWKVLGAVALLLPQTPRLKEWAYAGAVFDFTGAAASHLAAGDDASKLVAPVLFTALVVASWALRPASRRLAGPIW